MGPFEIKKENFLSKQGLAFLKINDSLKLDPSKLRN